MKKLFGHKPKAGKAASGSRDFAAEEASKSSIPTPLYQKLATHGNHIQGPLTQQQQPPPQQPQQVIPDEQWEVVTPHPDGIHLPNPHPPPVVNPPSRTSSFGTLPQGTVASPPLGSPAPPRSASPMSMSTVTNISNPNKLVRHHDRERDAYLQAQANAARKKNQQQQPTAPVALGILRALDPPRSEGPILSTRSHSEDRYSVSESGHRDRDRDSGDKKEKEKRGFWGGRDKEKERDKEREREREKEMHREKDREAHREKELHRERERERVHDRDPPRGREIRREDEGQAELTRMIGYLTATASEDWALVLEVCDRASANETSAKEAVRALRREFKYGEPAAQLSAARLWAIMLRNSSDIFISQSTSRKFLDTLEDLLSSSRTSPVVRERVLEVVAAAAYASGSKKDGRQDQGFKGLWKRVKPFDKPEEGVPFDTDDAMLNPPISGRLSGYEIPIVSYQEPSPLPLDSTPMTPTPATPTPNATKKRKSPTRNRIIPPDEDMRRLFQECQIGQGNASLLSQALALSRPEDLRKKDIIKEFYAKCQASQELIFAQIPWASAGAERSRAQKGKESGQMRNRTISNDINLGLKELSDSPVELTVEEKLLAALLAANAELLEALKQWEDLDRVATERKVEDRSRKETRMDRRHRDQEYGISVEPSSGNMAGGSSRTPSPPSRSHSPLHPALAHPRPHHLPLSSESDIDPSILGQNLAPPPAAPHGPRSPAQASLHSRTPSPKPEPRMNGHGRHDDSYSLNGFYDEDYRPPEPSAKALGKRKVVDPDTLSGPPFEVDDMYYTKDQAFSTEGADPDYDDEHDARWRQPPVQFVYDAVAERTRQRLEGGGHELLSRGVH